jgi:hypothetical protein
VLLLLLAILLLGLARKNSGRSTYRRGAVLQRLVSANCHRETKKRKNLTKIEIF